MPDPKPNHRRAAAEALMGESAMKYAQLEYPGHLVRWDEDADSVPLTRVMGLRPEQLTRTTQAIADAEERGRQAGMAELGKVFVADLGKLAASNAGKPEGAFAAEAEHTARAALEGKS